MQLNIIKYNDNNEIISGRKFVVTFQAGNGTIKNISYNYGTTIDKMLKKYLLRIDHPELINSNKIIFLYNAEKIKFGDQTVLEKIFKYAQNQRIVVME